MIKRSGSRTLGQFAVKFNNRWLGTTDTAYEGACLYAAHLATVKGSGDLKGKGDRWTAADEQVLMTMCSASPPATWKAIGTVLKRSARSVQQHASELRRLLLAPIAPRPSGRQAGSSTASALATVEHGQISGAARSSLSLPTAVASDLGELRYDPTIPTAVGTEMPLPYAEMPVLAGGVNLSVVAKLSGSDDPAPMAVNVLQGQ